MQTRRGNLVAIRSQRSLNQPTSRRDGEFCSRQEARGQAPTMPRIRKNPQASSRPPCDLSRYETRRGWGETAGKPPFTDNYLQSTDTSTNQLYRCFWFSMMLLRHRRQRPLLPMLLNFCTVASLTTASSQVTSRSKDPSGRKEFFFSLLGTAADASAL